MTNEEMKRYSVLFDILGFKRGRNTWGEYAMIKKYILPIPGIMSDNYANYYLRIGTAPVMWSCHTDTVHSESVTKGTVRQKLCITDKDLLFTQNGSCLGADNGVGVWLMLKMIEAKIEGLYIFHRGEESGGLGSHYIADNTPELVKDIKFAIAFDRRKNTSVITHQGFRTCSDAFADSLIAGLGLGHKKDNGGTFTDTKSYAELIPECTNVSAGFTSEHSKNETLDVAYVGRLLDALLKLDVSSLVCVRDLKAKKDYAYSFHGYGSTYSSGYGQNYRRYGEEYLGNGYGLDDADEEPDALDIIRRHPKLIQQVLEEWGMLESVIDEVETRIRY